MKRLLLSFLPLLIIAELAISQQDVNVSRVSDGGSAFAKNTENPILYAQLKSKSDTIQQQIEQLKSEIAKIKAAETSTMKANKKIDSLLYMNQERLLSALNSETDSLRSQLLAKSASNQNQINTLKAKLDNNQSQIDQLIVERAKSKLAEKITPSNNENTLLIAKLQTKSDTNQAQINRLEAKLAKTKELDKTAKQGSNSKNEVLNDENTILLAKLFIKSDSNRIQIDHLKSELEKSKDSEKAGANKRRSNDSILLVNSKASEVMLAQLKAKFDSNQALIDQLTVEHAKLKFSEKIAPSNNENALLIAKLQAKSDTNQVQIDHLKLAFVKTSYVEPSKVNSRRVNDSILLVNSKATEVMLLQLKAKFDNNQALFDQLVVERAKSKLAEKITPSNNENALLIAKLQAKSDSNQVQIDQLKSTLSKTKNAEPAKLNSGRLNDSLLLANSKASEVMLAQLKTKFDNNQALFDQLVVERAKSKLAEKITPSNNENALLIAKLQAKSDTNQQQLDQLKFALSKTNNAEPAKLNSLRINDSLLLANSKVSEEMLAQLKAKFDSNQAKLDQLLAQHANEKLAEKTSPSNNENSLLMAKLQAKSDTNQAQINRLAVELSKSQEIEKVAKKGPNTKDLVLNDENTILLAKLFVKSDSNRIQIEQLKSELAKSNDDEKFRTISRKLNDSLLLANSKASELILSQFKAKFESNQAQIDQLIVDQAKTKIASTITPSNNENAALIAKLATKSDSNQAQIEQLKVELVKTKTSGIAAPNIRKVTDSLHSAFKTETGILRAQLKSKSDSNQLQIDQLKTELEKARSAEIGSSKARRLNDSLLLVNSKASDVLLAQLKAKFDNNQTQLDQLLEQHSKEKLAEKTSPTTNENAMLFANLQAKSDSNQVQINRLEVQLSKSKEIEKTAKSDLNSKNLVTTDENNILVAKLFVKSDSNRIQIEQLKSELIKSNNTEKDRANTMRLKDSLSLVNCRISTEVVISQLKTKSDSNQAQIDRLKMELEKTKTAGTKNPSSNENDQIIAQLKAKSDINQTQIDQLKAELEKSKMAEIKVSTAGKVTDSLLYLNQQSLETALSSETENLRKQLKEKSDTSRIQIDQLKAELEKIKVAGTKNPSNTQNNLLIAQLKAKSDSNQVQIDRLKVELEKTKTKTTKTSSNAENNLLVTQLKVKLDSTQSQVDQIIMDHAKSKIAESSSPSNTANALLIAQLKVKSDSNQAQIEQLKVELEKTKGLEKTDKKGSKIKNLVSNDENNILLAKLFVKSDSNQIQIAQLKSELAKSKEAEMARANSRRLNDSLLLVNCKVSNEVVINQLKAKSDTNQVQIAQLKVELEKAKSTKEKNTSTIGNDVLMAQLKAKSDTNQAQIDRLKVELEKAKTAETKTAAYTENFVLITQLKTKSDTNQAQIERLKEELAKTKTAETKKSTNTENDVLIAQLKAKSDTNQAQIDRLKLELAKTKTAETKKPANTENDVLIAQLKAKSDNNQTQIDQLKVELEKAKEAITNSTAAFNSKTLAYNADAEALRAQLKAKSDADQAEINRLKAEHGKTNSGETTQVNPVISTTGVRIYKTDDFKDESGNPITDGFHVIIGAFGNKENAERFKAANIIKGHGNTKMIQNQVTKVYNIFVLKTNNRDDADTERMKFKEEYPSVWILKLE